RQVILFFAATALIGMGVDYARKMNTPLKPLLQLEQGIISIDLNKATLRDLLGTMAVSEKLAQKILEYRLDRGRFNSLEELREVKGIGEKRFEKLKELFFLE
ncbi:MAG: helix-hairpin-helix domain-containing protein, partial [Candidatus Omnitrophota bacterium]|nr:helix-hairpin-helix domain-containing protein [Candidatus Omnitrophota bacterium]